MWEGGHVPDAPHLTVELTFEILDSWTKDTPSICWSNPGRRAVLTTLLTFARTASPTREASLAKLMLGWDVDLPPLALLSMRGIRPDWKNRSGNSA